MRERERNRVASYGHVFDFFLEQADDPASRVAEEALRTCREMCGTAYTIKLCPRPCCGWPASHASHLERVVHLVTHEKLDGEWRVRDARSIAISLAHEIGHALDPLTEDDLKTCESDPGTTARRREREKTAWANARTMVERAGVWIWMESTFVDARAYALGKLAEPGT